MLSALIVAVSVIYNGELEVEPIAPWLSFVMTAVPLDV
jgi:hypothetical protein